MTQTTHLPDPETFYEVDQKSRNIAHLMFLVTIPSLILGTAGLVASFMAAELALIVVPVYALGAYIWWSYHRIYKLRLSGKPARNHWILSAVFNAVLLLLTLSANMFQSAEIELVLMSAAVVLYLGAFAWFSFQASRSIQIASPETQAPTA